ncbi:hypothetical protein PHSY_002025 [Pseudozyma hubeiensis SY62]|uniref:Uncharacterized protein n=1 Tax=Pseudozyma hubeiensis (strain SY62) TaxID=1305764 RepID=R9P056_PSEHS|nr:hypothetical protein PHSY_002025 [Pseudozyma hubeiensis SY62]GAC94454.1 hypothetical protein PHSY_002025 [Pseudozyma hubeiensis SY62]
MIASAAADAGMHEDAPSAIISLSWAFLVIPCIFLVAAFAWIMFNFSESSEFPESNAFGRTEHDADGGDSDDEKQQLLDAFRESQSHSTSHADSHTASGSSWKINGKFSTTSRGGSAYSSYPDPHGTYSPNSSPRAKRSSLAPDSKANKTAGSRAAKVIALNRDRMMQDLELDPVDREELQRSSSRASDIRKSD